MFKEVNYRKRKMNPENRLNFKFWFRALQEASVGSLFSQPKNFKIAFKDVKFDQQEKYYVDLTKALHNIKKIEDVNIGDEIQDYVVSSTAYWTVVGIDEKRKTIFLEPIGKNPFVPNQSGEIIGAGGKKFDQHDFEVMGGEYERKRIDSILDLINNKSYHDILDVAYILLGTVPVQVGPNGAQGGWYNAADRNNRGHMKGLETEEIIKKDAETLKQKLGFDIPDSALIGQIEPYQWTKFVNGDTSHQRIQTKLNDENFEDPVTMSKTILSHRQPQIRKRNAEALIQLSGKSDEIDNLIRETALKLANQQLVSEGSDRLWHIKEMFILLAGKKNWKDVLKAFSKSQDQVNRKFVARGLAKFGEKSLSDLIEMLKNEYRSEAFGGILEALFEIVTSSYENWNSSYGGFFSAYSFQKFIEEEPNQGKKIKNLINQIFPLIKSKYEEIKTSSPRDDYYLKDVEIFIERFQMINDLLSKI
jgi:hypothetical protein